MSTTTLRRSTIARLAFAATTAGVLVLSGCGGGDEDSRPDLTAGGGDESSSTTEEPSPSESETEESPSPTPEDPETADVFDISVGDCLSEEVGEGEVSEVPVVPCEGPHDTEVYLAVTMADADAFPGAEAVDTSSQECVAQGFTDFVGLEYNSSVLEASTLTPTEESWSQGDREILCLLQDPAGPVTGSLRGANR